MAAEVYAWSATTRSGRVRGRPGLPSRTLMVSSTAVKYVVSAAFPPVSTNPNGLPAASAARWTLQVIVESTDTIATSPLAAASP